MHPVLIDFGQVNIGGVAVPLAVGSYGVFFFVGVVVAWMLVHRLGRQLAPATTWTDLLFNTVLAGFLGAKVANLLVFLPDVVGGRRGIFAVLMASGVWVGGVLVAIPVALILLRRRRLDVGQAMNLVFVAVPLAHVPGRTGCFLAGCCYGTATDLPWAVTFYDPLANQINGTPLNVPVHPVQLYESALELGNFLLCFLLWRRRPPAWSVMACWLGLYGGERFGLEFLRGNPRGALGPLSTSQWLALGMMAAALVILWRIGSRRAT